MVSQRLENQLEVALNQHFKVDNSLLTRSGSTVIILAMQASGLEIGAEVIIPASCCPIVMYALQMAGYQVVLADVSLQTLNCDLSHIKAASSENTRAILAVHAYGRVCDITNIIAFAAEKGIVVIEDACLAYGASYEGLPIGSLADASLTNSG